MATKGQMTEPLKPSISWQDIATPYEFDPKKYEFWRSRYMQPSVTQPSGAPALVDVNELAAAIPVYQQPTMAPQPMRPVQSQPDAAAGGQPLPQEYVDAEEARLGSFMKTMAVGGSGSVHPPEIMRPYRAGTAQFAPKIGGTAPGVAQQEGVPGPTPSNTGGQLGGQANDQGVLNGGGVAPSYQRMGQSIPSRGAQQPPLQASQSMGGSPQMSTARTMLQRIADNPYQALSQSVASQALADATKSAAVASRGIAHQMAAAGLSDSTFAGTAQAASAAGIMGEGLRTAQQANLADQQMAQQRQQMALSGLQQYDQMDMAAKQNAQQVAMERARMRQADRVASMQAEAKAREQAMQGLKDAFEQDARTAEIEIKAAAETREGKQFLQKLGFDERTQTVEQFIKGLQVQLGFDTLGETRQYHSGLLDLQAEQLAETMFMDRAKLGENADTSRREWEKLGLDEKKYIKDSALELAKYALEQYKSVKGAEAKEVDQALALKEFQQKAFDSFWKAHEENQKLNAQQQLGLVNAMVSDYNNTATVGAAVRGQNIASSDKALDRAQGERQFSATLSANSLAAARATGAQVLAALRSNPVATQLAETVKAGMKKVYPYAALDQSQRNAINDKSYASGMYQIPDAKGNKTGLVFAGTKQEYDNLIAAQNKMQQVYGLDDIGMTVATSLLNGQDLGDIITRIRANRPDLSPEQIMASLAAVK